MERPLGESAEEQRGAGQRCLLVAGVAERRNWANAAFIPLKAPRVPG